jgi:hypothetical protein
MTPVIQEESTGCGIAAVAAVAGVTYAQARARARGLGIVAADPLLWSDARYVRRLLASYGVRAAASERPFRGWAALPPVALLAIKWHRLRGRAHWHWVVYRFGPDGPMVLDSSRRLRRHVRTDFGRMHPKWYIGIRPLSRWDGAG